MSQHCTYNYSQKGFSREKNLSRERAKNTVDNGYHYYGARYYNSNLSIWLSVDPLSDLSPNMTPYHFVSNNPIMRIDPNGLTDFLNGETGESIHMEDGSDDIVMIGVDQYQSVLDLSLKSTWNQDDSEQYFSIIEGGTSYSPNEYGMYQFPESGNGFARYTDASGNNNGNNENYTVEGQTHHTDNWTSKETFLSLYKTIQEFHKEEPGVTIHYGDISAYDPSIDLKHRTHFAGNSIDIHYFSASGTELRGKSAYSHAGVCLINSFFRHAENNGFTRNYSYGNRFTHVGNNNHSVHKDHLHIGR